MRFCILICSLILITIPAVAQTTYQVTLTGLEVVPRVNTPAMGNLETWVESDTLYVRGTFSDLIDTFWAAHIHYGEKGKNGNRMFRLQATLNEDKRSGEFRQVDNKFHLRAAQLEAIRAGNLYINISTHRHQQGEIRGQIPRM